MAKLVIASGPDLGREIPLGETQIIGRLPTNPIPIKDEGSSRQHTRIYRSGKSFAVIDLNSKNGTFVNNEQIQRADLKNGDLIRVGSTSFRFIEEPGDDAPASAGPRTPRGPAAISSSDEMVFGGSGKGKPVSDSAIRYARTTTQRGPMRWLRADFSQHPILYRALLLLGIALLMTGIAVTCYRLTAS
jgi:pSer/pThr/pTyr-binding forkhead associated (FHA) protein